MDRRRINTKQTREWRTIGRNHMNCDVCRSSLEWNASLSPLPTLQGFSWLLLFQVITKLQHVCEDVRSSRMFRI
jgi:hypothetical protein